MFDPSISLGPGLSHERSRDGTVLLTEAFQLQGQLLRVGSRKIGQSGKSELLQHLSPLGTNATHFAEVPLRSRLGITDPAPATERALATIRRKGRWIGPKQILSQLAQGFIQLALQAAVERQTFLLQSASGTGHRQRLGHCRPLQRLEQPASQGQRQAMFSGQPTPLTGEHWPIGEGAPAALAGDPLQEGRMGLKPPPAPGRAGPPETHPHGRRRPLLQGSESPSGFFRQQRDETALLIIQLKGAMG